MHGPFVPEGGVTTSLSVILVHSVAAGPPWGSARELSLSAHMGGGPPPHFWLRGGWRHHATLSGYVRYYWDVGATWNGWFLTEPSE
jgi:hypothetical protein